ncbi:DMT family transporter [Rhodocyclus gracilis]|uniref:DMT family transporter n=1 Tax=Rhodocyclus gracilis TaxID=2929842 RepID=UPI001E30FCE4|nr:DMT family transporter [Rhodocyclus gracilis]
MDKTFDRLPRTGLILLAAITLGWGLNWPVMKIVLSEVPPLSFRGSCLFLGGVGMLAIAHFSGQGVRIPRGRLPAMLLLTLFNIVGWNVLAIYGVSLLSSGRAALLGYTMPLWGVLLSAWLLGERLDRRRLAGLGLGLTGVVFLMGDGVALFRAAPAGALCMLGAAFSWALGVVLLKRLPLGMPAAALTGWMMLLGSLPMLLVAGVFEWPRLHIPSLWPALGLVYNVLVAFMFCYWAWNRIVLMVPVSVSSLSSLATPLIGVLGGMLILGERPGWHEGVAALCILGAIACVSLAQRPGTKAP